MRLSNVFTSAIVALAAVICSTPELDAQGRQGQGREGQAQGQGQGGRQGRGAQGQGRGAQGRGAQGRGGGFGSTRGGGTSLLGLLGVEAVQKEVDLADEQKADLDKLRASLRANRGDRTGGLDFRSLRELGEEERAKKIAELREKSAADRAKREKEENTKVGEILLPPQLARVKEIRIQLMGLRALSDKEVVAKLEITTAQQKQITEIPEKAQAESREKMREAFSNVRDLSREDRTKMFTEFREKAAAQQKETDTKVLGVLTSKQKSEFETLKGKPFKMPERQARQRTGGAQRGAQGRGNGDTPSRGTQGRGNGDAPSRGTQGRGNAPTTPEKPDDN